MRKFLLLTAALFVAGNAAAADLGAYKAPLAPPPALFTWSGIYVGANGGFGWENTATQYSYSSIPAPAPPGFQDIFGPGRPLNVGGSSAVSSALADGFVPSSLGRTSADVAAVGGQFGINYQVNWFVAGIEADLDWIGGVKNATYTAPANGFVTNSDTQSAGLEWLGTVRARAGYAFDRAWLFATGGLAYGRVTATSSGSGSDGTNTDLFSGGASGIRTGYAVGGGLEYAFTNNFTFKAEYLYYNLGTATYAVTPANTIAAGEGLIINASQKFDGSLVRLGLNWKLGY